LQRFAPSLSNLNSPKLCFLFGDRFVLAFIDGRAKQILQIIPIRFDKNPIGLPPLIA